MDESAHTSPAAPLPRGARIRSLSGRVSYAYGPRSAIRPSREPLHPDDHVPLLDAPDREPARTRPRVVGEAPPDLVVVAGLDDQERPQAPLFAARERPGEEDEALGGQVVHERGVIGHIGLGGDPAIDPA